MLVLCLVVCSKSSCEWVFDAFSLLYRYGDYRLYMIEHLITLKICHWDTHIRSLACRTLYAMVDRDTALFLEKIFPELVRKASFMYTISSHHHHLFQQIPRALSDDLAERHGCLMSISEILLRLSELNMGDSISDELQKVHITWRWRWSIHSFDWPY